MNDSFKKLKTLLAKNGYGKIIQALNKEQVIDMIKDEILDDDINLSKPFETNKQLIYNKFYDKNWVTLYTIFSEDDVESLYICVQELVQDSC